MKTVEKGSTRILKINKIKEMPETRNIKNKTEVVPRRFKIIENKRETVPEKVSNDQKEDSRGHHDDFKLLKTREGFTLSKTRESFTLSKIRPKGSLTRFQIIKTIQTGY